MSEETAGAATLPTAEATKEAPAPERESILTVATGGDSTKDQGTTEDKASDQKDAPKAADEAAKKDAEGEQKAESAGVPEKYELKAPEGMVLDEAMMAKAEPVFKELGLTNEGAQKLADLYAGAQQEFTTQIKEAWVKQDQEWLAEIKADKEFGGTNYLKNAALAQSAIAWVESKVPGFTKEIGFERLGLVNNPFLAKAFSAIGDLMREDVVPGASQSAGQEGNMFLPGSKRK
ncbi:MAG: peptidase [Dehalococcoidia bacterium]|jgi:hypothetical protein